MKARPAFPYACLSVKASFGKELLFFLTLMMRHANLTLMRRQASSRLSTPAGAAAVGSNSKTKSQITPFQHIQYAAPDVTKDTEEAQWSITHEPAATRTMFVLCRCHVQQDLLSLSVPLLAQCCCGSESNGALVPSTMTVSELVPPSSDALLAIVHCSCPKHAPGLLLPTWSLLPSVALWEAAHMQTG